MLNELLHLTPQKHPFVRRRLIPEGYVLIFHNKAYFVESDIDQLWTMISGLSTVQEIAMKYSRELAISEAAALPIVVAGVLQFEKLGLVRFANKATAL